MNSGNLLSVTIVIFHQKVYLIPYDYTVEVRNRFRGLDMIDRVAAEVWKEVHDIVQETGIKNMTKEKKCSSISSF